MEDGIVVIFVLHVGEEVVDCPGSLRRKHLHRNIAIVRLQHNDRCVHQIGGKQISGLESLAAELCVYAQKTGSGRPATSRKSVPPSGAFTCSTHVFQYSHNLTKSGDFGHPAGRGSLGLSPILS